MTLMIGRPLETAFPAIDRPRSATRSLLAGQPAAAAGASVRSISTLRRGEIVGIAGAEGNGQVQFLRALAGVEPSNGTVRCAGQAVDLA